MNKLKPNITLLLFLFIIIIIRICSLNLPFFWDNILLGSQMPSFIYDTHFSTLIFEPKLDVGYPPFFSIYMAAMWKLFGRTLLVSHLSMLPILIGLGIQLYKLAERFLSGKYLILCLALFFAEPTILTQLTTVGPELLLLFVFLAGLNAIFKKSQTILFICLVALPLLSYRGTLMSASLVFTDFAICFSREKWKAINFRRIIFYTLAAIFASSWYIYHYTKTGWLIVSPLNERGLESPFELLRNIFVIGFIMTEFGRFVLWLFVAVLLIVAFRQKQLKELINKTKELFVISLASIVSLTLLIALIKNPTGPRYFMFAFVLLIVCFVYLLQEIQLSSVAKKAFIAITFITLITGHLWVFEKISNAWDSNLAYLPYLKAKEKTDGFIVKNLPNDTLGTQFPMLESPIYTHLNNNIIHTKIYNLNTDKYILYSNISNDFEPEEIETLKKWNVVHEEKNKWIVIRIYKNPAKDF